MPVVINEFEVVAEPPQPSATQAQEPASGAAAPTPHELERIIEHQRERLMRIWAH